MKIRPYLLLLTCFGTVALLAQPVGIDLGGEDTAVGPLKPPAISQVEDPAAWLLVLLRGDTLRMKPGGMQVGNEYKLQVVSNPGPIEAYESLNLFLLLEDHLALQDYLLNRAYGTRTTSSPNIVRSSATRRATTAPSRNTNRVQQSPTRTSQSATLNQSAIATAEVSDKVKLSSYPLVRQYAFGRYGLTANPAYLAKPSTQTTLDTDYAISYNVAIHALKLYQLALIQPSYPSSRPIYLFDATTDLFGFYFLNIIDELELASQTAGQKVYHVAMLRRGRTPGAAQMPHTWSAADRKVVTDQLHRTAITAAEKQTLNETEEVMGVELRKLKRRSYSLDRYYTEHNTDLSEQEREWFDWVLRTSKQIIGDLTVNVNYLKELNQLSVSATTYGHLIKATQLLRETQSRISNLPKAAEAAQVLDQITASYLAKVRASGATFKQLRR